LIATSDQNTYATTDDFQEGLPIWSINEAVIPWNYSSEPNEMVGDLIDVEHVLI